MALTRKAVLFIVEGLSDKDALEKIFRTIYKKDRTVEFRVTDVVNGVPDNMSLSWVFIKSEMHSLERHTNLHIYFSLHPVLS